MALTFTQECWDMLEYMRDKGGTEIAMWGIGSKENPLHITELVMPEQEATACTVDIDDDSTNKIMAQKLGLEDLEPEQVCRVWIHTHPGNSAQPSSVDEDTLDEFGQSADWRVMAILAKGGETYARFRKMIQLGDKEYVFEQKIPMGPVGNVGAQIPAYDEIYNLCVKKKTYANAGYGYAQTYGGGHGVSYDDNWNDWDDEGNYTPNAGRLPINNTGGGLDKRWISHRTPKQISTEGGYALLPSLSDDATVYYINEPGTGFVYHYDLGDAVTSKGIDQEELDASLELIILAILENQYDNSYVEIMNTTLEHQLATRILGSNRLLDLESAGAQAAAAGEDYKIIEIVYDKAKAMVEK